MSGSGRERWLLAGQELLRRLGIRGVKIEALVDETGLTTGSFYHHFPNMAAYRKDLADFYGWAQVKETLSSVGDADPAERLRHIASVAQDESLGSLDAAMRDWAGSDPVAADAVRALDTTLLEHFEGAFRDMGHDEPGARLRAFMLLSSGVARVHLPWPLNDPAGAVLDLLER